MVYLHSLYHTDFDGCDGGAYAGSRDQQVKLWRVNTEEDAPKANTQPLYSALPAQGKP